MDLSEYKRIKEETRKRLEAEGVNIITRELGQFFERVPQLKSLHWRQYTPYFNDGEPCVFRVHEVSMLFEGDEPWVQSIMERYCSADEDERERYPDDFMPSPGIYGSDWNPPEKQLKQRMEEGHYARQRWLVEHGVPEDVWVACCELNVLLVGVDEILQSTLGDHLKVKVYRDEAGEFMVETEHYEHD